MVENTHKVYQRFVVYFITRDSAEILLSNQSVTILPSYSTSYHFNTFWALFLCQSEYWECPEGVQRYLYRDLARATNDFSSSHEIGIGGFGKVFLGVVDGKKVAIKRAHSSIIQSSSGFRNEIILLSRLHHRNLVHLLGFCEEDGVQVGLFFMWMCF